MSYTSPCGPSSSLLPFSSFPLLSSHLLSLLALLFPSLLGWSIFLSGFRWAKHGARRGGGSPAEPHVGSLLHHQLPLEWSSPSPAPTPAHQPERWSSWQYRLPGCSHRYSSRGRGLLGHAGRETGLVMWPFEHCESFVLCKYMRIVASQNIILTFQHESVAEESVVSLTAICPFFFPLLSVH